MDKNKKIKIIKWMGVSLAAIAALKLFASFLIPNSVAKIPLPVVVAQTPKKMEMAEYITQTGSSVAYNSVDLVARVEGYLDEITFKDGSFVKKNQPLFVIEPKPYLDKLHEAEATVVAEKASADYTKAEYARQQRMYKENATSLNNVEKWAAKNMGSDADVAKAKANADIAAITYSYTHIQAPFDGRIGRHLVDVGNLVGNGAATNLATIEQISPIYVYFNLNELDLIKLRKAARTYGYDAQKISQIPVDIGLQNETDFPHKGRLDFINTGLNSSTGTMEFRAVLANKDLILVPGLFVQVRVAITKKTPQLTVPDTSILYDQIGPYVLLVSKNDVVALNRVELGSLEEGNRAILKGITASDKVIIEGLQFATPGKPVALKSEKNGK